MGKDGDYVSVPLYDNEAVYPIKAPKMAAAVVLLNNPKKKRGWCCSPCMAIIIGLFVGLVVAPILLGTIAFLSGYYYIAEQVKTVTVTERRYFPATVDIPESELIMVQDRATLFWKDLVADRTPAQDLIITADELNGMMALSDYLRGNAYVHLEEDKITFETSLPLAGSFLPGGKDRYFVSTSVVAMKGSTLSVNVDAPIDILHGHLIMGLLKFGMDDADHHHVVNLLPGSKAFGLEPSDDFYQQNANIIEFLYEDTDADDDDFPRALDNLATIKVMNNKIIFTGRQHPTPDGDVDGASSSETSTTRLSPWHLLRRMF